MFPPSISCTIRLLICAVPNEDYLVVTWYLHSRYAGQEMNFLLPSPQDPTLLCDYSRRRVGCGMGSTLCTVVAAHVTKWPVFHSTWWNFHLGGLAEGARLLLSCVPTMERTGNKQVITSVHHIFALLTSVHRSGHFPINKCASCHCPNKKCVTPLLQ